MGRVISLSYCVDKQLLDCLERGVPSPETLNNGGEDLLERDRGSHILGAVLEKSLA